MMLNSRFTASSYNIISTSPQTIGNWAPFTLRIFLNERTESQGRIDDTSVTGIKVAKGQSWSIPETQSKLMLAEWEPERAPDSGDTSGFFCRLLLAQEPSWDKGRESSHCLNSTITEALLPSMSLAHNWFADLSYYHCLCRRWVLMTDVLMCERVHMPMHIHVETEGGCLMYC